MAETTHHDIELSGCTPEPLMAYLKALGILRLVSEQRDPGARGWWKNDVFWLRSTLDRGSLERFFLEEYEPTPIVAPWAGGSGFFKKDNKKAVEALRSANVSRCKAYVDVIHRVRGIIADENVGDKPIDKDKARLIRRYRRELSDEVAAWMDAAMVIQQDRQAFAPLLGTGGNDGRLDFTQNFMQRIVSLGLHDNAANTQSASWLAQALFLVPTKLNSASVGQFAPGRAGGPNATQSMEGDSFDNPWEFLLMMEGTLLLAGAAVRRFGVAESVRAAFPFTVRAIAAGFDSPASKDEAESRGELWLPLWGRRMNDSELRQMFGEGRADVFGRSATNGADFARAVASLGVDRGVSGFSRTGFLKRSGKAYLATPIGRFHVAERRGVDLLREVDSWLDRFRRAAGDKNAPPRFGAALRRIDSAIFNYCKYGGGGFFQKIIIALGTAERELGNAGRFREAKKLLPLGGLSADWIKVADDNSPEFTIARALASTYDPEGKIGPLRADLEPVDWQKRCRAWAEKGRSILWAAGSLPENLVSVLERRIMDGLRAGCRHLPIASAVSVPLDTVALFMAGLLDDRHIEDLIWGIMLVDTHRVRGRYGSRPIDGLGVPRAYALLKLLHIPRSIVVERRADGAPSVHTAGDGEAGGIIIRPEPSVPRLLCAGRVGEACVLAMRRLRASGLVPMPTPIRGRRVRDDDWRELDGMGSAGVDPLRLAAALLIPVDDRTVNSLFHLVICGDETKDDQAEFVAAGNSKGENVS